MLGLDRGRHFGRLVEHQNLRLRGERFGNLDQLALGDRELIDPGALVEARADRGELLLDPVPAFFGAGAPRGRHAVQKILSDRQLVEHGRVLIDDADTERLRQARLGGSKRRTADFDRAAIGRHRAGGDGHEGRLARAILAQKSMDLALDDLERNSLERDDARKGLDDVGQAQNSAGSHSALSYSVLP